LSLRNRERSEIIAFKTRDQQITQREKGSLENGQDHQATKMDGSKMPAMPAVQICSQEAEGHALHNSKT
jgi:hypothetical protein